MTYIISSFLFIYTNGIIKYIKGNEHQAKNIYYFIHVIHKIFKVTT